MKYLFEIKQTIQMMKIFLISSIKINNNANNEYTKNSNLFNLSHQNIVLKKLKKKSFK